VIGNLLGPELKAYIEARDFTALRAVLCEFAAPDIAEILADLSAADKALLLRILPHQLAADVFEYLSLETQEELVQALSHDELVNILNEMAADDRTALLEELPAPVVTRLLKLLAPKERTIAQTLLNYPEGTVGRLMTPDFIAIRDEWTVQQVLDHIRQHGQDSETLNVVYVVADKGHLIDDVRIREFLLRPLTTRVSEIRDTNFTALKVTDNQRDVVQIFRKYDRTVLPVVDSDGKLIGIVTVDDVLDVAERRATEEIQKLGGSEALDEPYLTITLPRMIKKRAPWLIILFLSEMLTTTAMSFFEDEIARAVVLALFLPLIISSGGNSGSQATTLIIRAMALGEVALRQWWHVMRREIISGLFLGTILGAIGFIRIMVWHVAFDSYGQYWPLIGITIFFSLMGVVLWGTLSGSMLPFLLRRCGLDPAACSAPFVATLVDVTGLIIYFTLAMAVLHNTLLAPSSSEVARLGGERGSEAFGRLMHLDKSWEVKEVLWETHSNKIVLAVSESDDIKTALKCDKCGGPLRIKSHEAGQSWPYLSVFENSSIVSAELPVLGCKKCGEIKKFTPPWTTNAPPLR
jgi:magnesium transporter